MAKKQFGLAITFVVALVGLLGVLEYQRQTVSASLGQLGEEIEQMQQPEEQGPTGQELAEQIVAEVRKLIEIPEDIEPTVATIVDVEVLRERNPFYNKAENGDHLVVTSERAILYSSKENKIIDVVPVQLEPANAEGSGE